MNRLTFCLVGCLLLAAIMLTGCGGGGGGAKGIAGGPGFEITVLPDAGYESHQDGPAGVSKASSTNSERQIISQLDKGAKIEAFDFETGHLLGQTTIGADGKGKLTLPSNKTVLIIVTGKKDGKDYRLSAIIPCVYESGDCYVGPAETLAAEAIAQKHYKQTMIDEDTWDAVLDKAKDVLDGMETTPDISIGGGLVTNTDFGKPGSIDPTAAADIINEVPNEINSSLIKAKNTVRMVNQTAMPLQDILDQEYLGVQRIASATYQGIEAAGLNVTINKYKLLGNRLDQMMVPLLEGDFSYNGRYDATLDDLTVGKKYRLTVDEWDPTVTEITGGTAGVITIIREDGPGVLTVVAKKVGDRWEVTQTSSADAKLNYTAKVSFNADGDAEDWTISLKDNDITTPVTFKGSISAKKLSANKRQGVFNGTLSSKEVEAKAKVTVIATEVSDGIYEGKITLDDLNASYESGAVKATVRGQVATDFESKETYESWGAWRETWVEERPTSIDVSKLNIEITANGGKSSFNLTGKVDFVNNVRDHGWYSNIESHPTNVEALSFSASLNNDDVSVKGKLKGSAIVVGEDQKVYPKEFRLTDCEYRRKGKTGLVGAFIGVWINPGSSEHLEGTINVDARLQRTGYEDLTVDLALAADGAGGVVLTVNKLGWLNNYFTGTGAATLSDGYPPEINTATLTLVSNNGVTIDFTDKNMNGSVKVGGEKQGDISKHGNVVEVEFTDGTTTSLIGNIIY